MPVADLKQHAANHVIQRRTGGPSFSLLARRSPVPADHHRYANKMISLIFALSLLAAVCCFAPAADLNSLPVYCSTFRVNHALGGDAEILLTDAPSQPAPPEASLERNEDFAQAFADANDFSRVRQLVNLMSLLAAIFMLVLGNRTPEPL